MEQQKAIAEAALDFQTASEINAIKRDLSTLSHELKSHMDNESRQYKSQENKLNLLFKKLDKYKNAINKQTKEQHENMMQCKLEVESKVEKHYVTQMELENSLLRVSNDITDKLGNVIKQNHDDLKKELGEAISKNSDTVNSVRTDVESYRNRFLGVMAVVSALVIVSQIFTTYRSMSTDETIHRHDQQMQQYGRQLNDPHYQSQWIRQRDFQAEHPERSYDGYSQSQSSPYVFNRRPDSSYQAPQRRDSQDEERSIIYSK